jgi:succinoglycan biosynthesis protein ExoA
MQESGARDTRRGESEPVDCSVLVPVLNERRHIRASVDAMLEQHFPGRLEFLLVDGGSTDGTRSILSDLARRDPRLRVLDNPRRSTPSGLNIALAHARGRWVARMDGHTEYPRDYLALGVERLRRGDTRWVSGPQVATGDGPVSRAVALALRTPLGRGGSRKWGTSDGAVTQEYELDSGVFAGVWERETLLQYGGWDEGWPRNQDSEMAGRFLARGERLICLPEMAARYTPRDSIRSLWRQYLQYGDYREKTALRHPHTMRRSHLIAPSLVLTLGAAIAGPARLRRVARGGLGAYAVALAGAGARAAFDERVADAGDAGAAPAGDRLDVALVPVVLAVMHLAHGAGAIKGSVRRGPPIAAIAMALGARQLAVKFTSPPQPVCAPSLGRSASGAPATDDL